MAINWWWGNLEGFWLGHITSMHRNTAYNYSCNIHKDTFNDVGLLALSLAADILKCNTM